MSLYKPWYVTKALTAAVQSATTSGNKVTFKYMVASRDKIDDRDLSGLTNDLLKTIKVDDKVLVSSSDVSNNDTTVVAVFTDKGVIEEHQLNTILLVAEYNGKELLAGVLSANTPYLMPKENDNEHAEYTFRAVLSLANTGVVNVELNPEALATNDSVNKVRSEISDLSTKVTTTSANVNNQNEFKENTIFDKDVTVNGRIKGIADKATNADFAQTALLSNSSKRADYADKAGESGWANGAGQANKLVDGSNVNVNDLDVHGIANLKNGLSVMNGIAIKNGGVTTDKAIFVGGGGINTKDGIDSYGLTYAHKDLTVDGSTKLNGDLVTKKADFMGGGYFHENVDVKSDADVHGKFTAHADAYFLDGVVINSGGIFVNGSTSLNGDVQINGHLNGTNTREVVHMGIGDVVFWRFGHTVFMFYDGYYGDTGYTLPWGNMSGFNVPAGYRPAEKTLVTVCNNWKTTHANIDLGGNLIATETEYNRNTNIEIQGIWQTNDGFRI